MTLLAARAVARRFGSRLALEPTDLALHARETVALVGPNGAGKSTLLAILAGSLKPSAGTVESQAKVGWVPQRPALYGRLTPRENLELFARLEGEREPVAVGNRQRLNVALALLGDPRVLLLDEPTAALDPGQRRRLWHTVAAVKAAGGAVCFATQNVDELEHVADRVVALQDGRVVFSGSVADYEASAVDVFG
jgi:ABC-2 type transport system ATP-binding protein